MSTEETKTNAPLEDEIKDSPSETSEPSEPAKKARGGKESKTVQVPEETLEKLLARMEKLESDNEVLKEVADKGRLNRVEQLRNSGKLIKVVNINVYEEQYVIGWKKLKEDVYFDREGRLHEEQTYEVFLRDGTSRETDLRGFARNMTKSPAEVIEEGKDRDGNTNFLVQLKDGGELKIDAKFVN